MPPNDEGLPPRDSTPPRPAVAGPPEDAEATHEPVQRLRRWPPPELPERPYPVLLPYTHPALLAGRDRELAKLQRLLRLPLPILGLCAPSGAGKSSLLLGGLVPGLRERGRPVALARHPHEPGLAARLLGDLLVVEPTDGSDDPDHQVFVDRLFEVERLAGGEPPILVLDQFEDVLRRPEAGPSRAALGVLLAATAQRPPGRDTPPCRWLLAYRQEAHGDVVAWLRDVLRDTAREALSDALPADLSTPDRFHHMTLPALATPLRGSDPIRQATEVFGAAIEKPLALTTENGEPRYRWRFAPGAAERLARAFAEARLARPEAPLTPELQVVLAHLLAQARDGLVEVPAEPAELIDRALEDHLRRALESAFPTARGPGLAAEQRRARALLALRELASASGERGAGLPLAELSHAIGPDGEEILHRLSTPLTRLVVAQERAEGWCYVLSHDRMAEVVVRLVEQEGRRGSLLVDPELLALRRFVRLGSALHGSRAAGATRLPRRHYRRIAAHAEALLWDAPSRAWWAACQRRRRAERRRAVLWAVVAVIVLTLITAGAWSQAHRLVEHRALLEQIAEGDPETALHALDRLAADPDTDRGELLARLRQRASPSDLLERGLGGVGEERRGVAVLRAAELMLPILDATPDDPVLIANLVWALDYAPCREPRLAPRARTLRDRVLEPLRRGRPPPLIGPSDAEWAPIPGGTFRMGAERQGWGEIGPEDARWIQMASPAHQVTLSPFRMLIHEVTSEEFRRLFPDHPGSDALPARSMTWYEGYTYAAWLGGRLPTEAEWELAARAGCRFAYCTRDGEEATVDQVAWTAHNATDPVTRDASLQPVMRLEPNPWGLFDMYGNLNEGVADWFGEYPTEPQHDPQGPTHGPGRVGRSGNYHMLEAGPAHAILRGPGLPSGRSADAGFRVVLPACR